MCIRDRSAYNEKIWTLAPPPPAQVEYTFSENLQAGAGGFDITDIQLVEPSGNVVDLSSNITGIVGGKLVIGTYSPGLYPQGNNYAISGVNATHSGTLNYSATPDHNTTHSTAKFHDGNTSTSWLSINDTYVSGTYVGSVSTATTNAGTINGEYVQIDVGVNSVLSHFTYYTQNSHKNYSPSSGSLVGSKDNVTWDVITSFSYDKDNDPNEVTKNISTLAEYRYYRLIFVAVNGGHVCGVNEWTLFGHVRENYYTGETISDTNYLLVYNKNATVNKNIIGATNNVAISSFRIDNNLLIGRGGLTNSGQYDGSTSTTLTDTSTYKGEYIQVDVGKNVIINDYAMNVKSINGNDNPKSWMLVGSLNNSDWTKLDEKFNHTLTENYTATVTSTKVRYLRLIINRGGTAKHIKISQFKVNGVEIRLEGQTYSASLDNGDANTVFDNAIATSWNTTSSYNYNGIDAAATNEATYSGIGLHTDASGNKKIELTFSADLSSNDLKYTDFTVTETDFSETIPILADISGGKLLIEKQANIAGSVLYEDFNDQVILGPYATATFEQGGILNGSFFNENLGIEFDITSPASIGGSTVNYHTLTEHNGKYYKADTCNAIDEVDFTNNTVKRISSWTAQSGLTTDGCLMFSYNGLLYTYGGGSHYTNNYRKRLHSYNVATDTWVNDVVTTGTSPRFWGNAYTLHGDTLYVIGVEWNDGTYDGETWKLDLTTMTWTQLDTTIGKNRGCGSFVRNNRLYLYGPGREWNTRNGNLKYLDLANPSNGWTSVTINDPNNLRVGVNSWFGGARRGAKGIAVKDDKLYYVGGWDEYYNNSTNGFYDNILHYIDLTTMNVHEIQTGMTWNIRAYRHTHFFIGDVLYLFAGGTGGNNGIIGTAFNAYYKIDITKTLADYGYRLKGEYTGNATVSTKIWRTPTVTHKAVSFWHRFYTTDGTNNNGHIWSSYFDENDKTNSHISVWLTSDELRWTVGSAAAGKMVRYYVDGVERTPVSTIHPYTYGHNNSNQWHFLYFEFSENLQFSHFLSRCIEDVHDYGARGPIDSVRLYNTSVSEAHIKEMYGGWDGMYPGASFDKTDYLIEYKKNSSSVSHIYDVNNTSVPINDFILRNGSLISRGTNYGHYSGSTTTTLADSSTSTGEYIEVNMEQQTYIINYELHVPTANAHIDNNVYPKSWTLLGSADGSSWVIFLEIGGLLPISLTEPNYDQRGTHENCERISCRSKCCCSPYFV